MNQTVKPISAFTILALAFFGMGVGTITPALNAIFVQFSDLPITTLLLVSTLPSLAVIPASIIAGSVAGSKVKYRTLAILGMALFVLGGVAPYFANDFTVILLERAIFGIGLGIISPLANSLVMGVYEGDKVATMTGIVTLSMNIGGMVLQFMGGFLAGVGWNYAFLPHGLGIISLILVIFFLPEPHQAPVSTETQVLPKEKLPLKVWITVLVYGIFTLCIYPMLVNMSTLIVERGLGTTATAGVVLSFLTIGGMVAGSVFGKVFKISGRFILAFGFAVGVIGLGIVVIAQNIVLLTVGAFLVGVAMSTLIPASMMIISMSTKPTQMAFSVSLFMAGMNLFGFLSTYWIGAIAAITGDAVTTPIAVGAVVSGIFCILYLVVNPLKPKAE
ncbi:MFS transporter [Acetobacterium woodii]|uniref:Major facilitator superfamily MFS_1 transporter n=1 Tax=Acetobacterium woodii (strain ATCC 29683 / DSM 1030 / JCM 2381 / KCTC 1655 / WB1) TaxID=931626 RepID=H6LGN5_ACEWD|nr:MFS transporter [Acetobacterium woodii]AFA48363.1 major facilitator superfamily MFS_1 transporter [Acetobacterium woodii DSM 1030]